MERANLARLQDFPAEVLQDIARELDYQSIIDLCIQSRYFQAAICDDQIFWKEMYQQNLSNNISGIKNFKQAYQRSVAPLVIGDKFNPKAWTDLGYRVVSSERGLVFQGKLDPNFTSPKGDEYFVLRNLQALDHHWEKRWVVDPKYVRYEYIRFLAGKNDVAGIKWYLTSANIYPDDTVRGSVATSAGGREVLEYIFNLAPLPQGEVHRVGAFKAGVARRGTVPAMEYLLALSPAQARDLSTLTNISKQNIVDPNMYGYLAALGDRSINTYQAAAAFDDYY